MRRNGKSDLLRGFEIDDELELDRLRDEKFSGISARQNLVDNDRKSRNLRIRRIRAEGYWMDGPNLAAIPETARLSVKTSKISDSRQRGRF